MTRLVIRIILIVATISPVKLQAQQFSSQQGGHCFTLDIPEYLTKTYQLNDAASLQYLNATKEAYVIVIEDSKDHLAEVGMKYVDAEDFLKDFIKDYQIESDNREVSDINNFEASDFGHSQVEMSWTSDGSDLYMLITTVETPEHFYKILCWTLMEYKDALKQDYIRIAQSLQE